MAFCCHFRMHQIRILIVNRKRSVGDELRQELPRAGDSARCERLVLANVSSAEVFAASFEQAHIACEKMAGSAMPSEEELKVFQFTSKRRHDRRVEKAIKTPLIKNH